MKKAMLSGERQAQLVDAPDPQPKEDWVVVKVHASAMCTEYKAFLAGRTSDIIGHEGAGEVVAVALPELAATTCVWRDLSGSDEEVCLKGLRMIREGWAAAG